MIIGFFTTIIAVIASVTYLGGQGTLTAADVVTIIILVLSGVGITGAVHATGAVIEQTNGKTTTVTTTHPTTGDQTTVTTGHAETSATTAPTTGSESKAATAPAAVTAPQAVQQNAMPGGAA